MRSLLFWSRPRIAGQWVCVVILAALASWSVGLGIPANPQSSWSEQHIAAMRAALMSIHRGKVDAATLAEISGSADLVAIHRGNVDSATLVRIAARSTMAPSGAVIPASFDRDNLADEISR